MKRTILPILASLLVYGIAVALTGVVLNRQPSQSGPVKLASEPIPQKTNTVSYKGVSFTFDPSLTSEVKSETTAAEVEDPTNIVPEHRAFTLTGYPGPKGYPQIRVFPIVKFREAVAEASRKYSKQVVYPKDPIDWTVNFDEEIRTLKALVAEKPEHANLTSVIGKARHGKNCSQMPFLPMWERCQVFVAHVRFVNFKNGQGAFFLTQYDRETTQVTNEGLEYVFQGITADGQYYVSAEFSVSAPFLPSGDEPDVVAWNEKNYVLPHTSKEYQNYLRPVLAKLEAFPADKFQPKFDLIEPLIQSLDIQKH